MSAETTNLLVAVPAAVGAAASFGLTGSLQHQATHRVPSRNTVRFSLLVDLAHQPLWLLSLVANAAGVVGQWIALKYAPLVLVQPILVTGVLFAVVFGAALKRRRPDRTVLVGSWMCVVGLAGFLLLARPSGGSTGLRLGRVLPVASALAAILVVCLVVAARRPGRVRTLSLAVGAGIFYGVTAGMVKLVVTDLQQGLGVLLTNWPVYVMLVCGPLGFLLNQASFQAGVALAPELAVIIITDPLVSIGIGITWLGENLDSSAGAVVGQVLGLLVMASGVVVLARRAPQVSRQTASP
ncbi:MAG: DMT family transporter [Actinomycetes bacterium]